MFIYFLSNLGMGASVYSAPVALPTVTPDPSQGQWSLLATVPDPSQAQWNFYGS
jgi:hypothetical protein